MKYSDIITVKKKYDENNEVIYTETINVHDDKENKIVTRDNDYDKKGRLIHFKDSTGEEKYYEYDDQGRLIRIKDLNVVFEEIEYDERGNKIFNKIKSHWTKWVYDKNNNVIQKTNGYYDMVLNEEKRSYDKDNNLIYIIYSNGVRDNYHYKSGHLDSIEKLNKETGDLISLTKYDEFGNIIYLNYSNDLIVEFEYEYWED